MRRRTTAVIKGNQVSSAEKRKSADNANQIKNTE